ncbi:MAG: tetratricopeptide repeat protein [Desulfobacteraceae bacterium]|nr:tetratricopeptide repeat protein [Desulfobacteraceae bacterium]
MAKKRVTRKELVKEPDEFITLTGKVIQWARQNTKPLIYGICAFLALILLISGFRYYNNHQEAAASDLLSKSLMSYQEADRKDEPEKALAAAKPEFERLINEYGGTSEGRIGGILYGHMLLAGHEPAEAAGFYEKALNNAENDPILRNVILNGLATVAMEKEDNAAAIGYLEKITAGRESVLKDSALFNLGRLYRISGDLEKSKKAFSQLVADFPDSMYTNMAREISAG